LFGIKSPDQSDMTRILSLALLIGLAAGGTALYSKYFRSDSGKDQFRVEKVTRGDLQINVRATGTIEPEETVDIGAQVVGRIKELGKDPRGNSEKSFAAKPVDYQTPVAEEKSTAPASTVPTNADPAITNPADAPSAPEKIDNAVKYKKKKLGHDSIGHSKSAPADKSDTSPNKTKAHVAAGIDTKFDPAFANKTVDYGSPVVKGMVLAQIDPAIYKAQFNQANASLAQANARVLQAQAMLAQANAEWERAKVLRELKIPSRSPTGGDNGSQALPIKGISDADYVLAQANAESAKADVEAAKAAVLQQTATLELAKTNLDYTTIISPDDGTIIERRVNIGQTVVSSLNAPSLFLIARDLRRMQVWASVNEADIAKVDAGTKVHFRVDALPDDTFHGVVVQRRYNAQMVQNVVIYTVVISVDNSDLKLLPYMTADVYFEVDGRSDALLVPNSALRFRPTPDQIDSDVAADSPAASAAPPARAGHRDKGAKSGKPSTAGKLWVVVPETGKLRPVEVQTGVSDLTVSLTEITSGDIKEGDEIVVGENRQAPAAGGDVTNPLAPPKFRSNRQSRNPS
jgi:HlyD family secretion protein